MQELENRRRTLAAGGRQHFADEAAPAITADLIVSGDGERARAFLRGLCVEWKRR